MEVKSVTKWIKIFAIFSLYGVRSEPKGEFLFIFNSIGFFPKCSMASERKASKKDDISK